MQLHSQLAPQSPTPHCTEPLSSVKPCPSFNELHCFCALWHEILLQSFTVHDASKKCLHIIKKKLECSSCYVIFLLLIFRNFLEPNWCVTSEIILILATVSLAPANHKHQNSTAQLLSRVCYTNSIRMSGLIQL